VPKFIPDCVRAKGTRLPALGAASARVLLVRAHLLVAFIYLIHGLDKGAGARDAKSPFKKDAKRAISIQATGHFVSRLPQIKPVYSTHRSTIDRVGSRHRLRVGFPVSGVDNATTTGHRTACTCVAGHASNFLRLTP
jgi:hypothetical protein